MTATKKHPNISYEEFEFYSKEHQGKNIIIKISGGEFQKTEFIQLVDTIHLLLENDITIFLVFGGGIQINQFYLQHLKNLKLPEIPRKK